MKFFRKMLLPITFVFVISGCSNANNEANDKNEEVTDAVSYENKNEVEGEVVEEATLKDEASKRNNDLDLLEIISLDKEGIIALLGQPQDTFEWEYGHTLSYDGLSISLNSSEKLES